MTIEIERRENPISGTVHSVAEGDRPFVGWMGLLAALEAALGGGGQADEDAGTDDAFG